ncbi:MAG TPA: zinc ribbon domain-containing protein, partial [Chloroflexia bacterium]
MAQICPACKTSNDDGATRCRQCGAALPGNAAKTTGGDGATSGKTTYRPAGTTPGASAGSASGTPAGSTSGTPAGSSPAARRAASSGAIAEAARRAAAQQKAAQAPPAAPATRAGTPGTRGEARTTPATRSPVRGPSRGIAAPINNALDRAGLPRFSTQRYLVIWAIFAVILVAVIIALVAIGASNARPVVPTPQPGAVLTGTVATVETSQGVFKLKLNTDDPSMKDTIENFRVKAASG